VAAFQMWADPCKIGVIDRDHIQPFLDVFSHTSYQPVAIGRIRGYNAGRGNEAAMTVFTMPHKAPSQ
nr:hypothetical protein [Pseudomonadota bacterium]